MYDPTAHRRSLGFGHVESTDVIQNVICRMHTVIWPNEMLCLRQIKLTNWHRGPVALASLPVKKKWLENKILECSLSVYVRTWFYIICQRCHKFYKHFSELFCQIYHVWDSIPSKQTQLCQSPREIYNADCRTDSQYWYEISMGWCHMSLIVWIIIYDSEGSIYNVDYWADTGNIEMEVVDVDGK